MSNKVLEFRWVPTHPIYTDVKSRADMSVAIYEPVFPKDPSWKFFGHQAVTTTKGLHYIDDKYIIELAPEALLVRELQPGVALKSPTGPGRKLWTDKDSGGAYDIEIFEPNAIGQGSEAFQPMGLFAAIVESYGQSFSANKKIQDAWDRLVLIKEEYLTAIISNDTGPMVWCDAGMGAKGNGIWNDISYWNPKRNISGLFPETFVATNNYKSVMTPSSPPIRALKWDSVSLEENSTSNWMHSNQKIHDRKLSQICLPATHDSGTYSLTEFFGDDPDQSILRKLMGKVLNDLKAVSDKIESIPGIGQFIPDPALWVVENALPAIIALSKAQSRSILQQLRDGIRCLDLRVYKYGTDYYVGHGGILGANMKTLLDEIAYFLTMTKGEIVYVTMGHWTNFESQADYDGFKKMVLDTLGEFAFIRTVDKNSDTPEGFGYWTTNPIFQKTYNEIISSSGAPSSKVVLVWDMWEEDWQKYMGPLGDSLKFWPGSYSPPSSGVGRGVSDPPYTMIAYSPGYPDASSWPNPGELQNMINVTNGGTFGSYSNTEEDKAILQQQWYPFAAKTNTSLLNDTYGVAVYITLTPQKKSFINRIVATLSKPIALAALPIFLVPVVGPPIGAALEVVAASLKKKEDQFTWKTLEELSKNIHVQFKMYETAFAELSKWRSISFIYTDYYQKTNLVAYAIQLSTQ